MSNDDDFLPWAPAFDAILTEARRSVDAQREAVKNVRDRAAATLAAAAAVAGLFVGLSKAHGPLTVAGLVVLVVSAFGTLDVLRPRTFEFDVDATVLRTWTHETTSPTAVIDRLGGVHWEHVVRNETILNRLHRIYVGICAGLVGEVVLLALDVVLH